MENNKYVILLVEDEKKLRLTISDYLRLSNFTIITAENGIQALDEYYNKNNIIDLIILDVMMPNMDGYEVLEAIRLNSEIPIIMLTAKSKESEQLYAFDKGADDYITKPFKLSLLKAHINAILKRVGNNCISAKCVGELRIETEFQKVYLCDELLTTTPKEYELLLYFVENINIVLSREQILNSVWGYDYDGEIRTVDTIVKQLRAKLTDKYPYIKSIYGVGYRFEV